MATKALDSSITGNLSPAQVADLIDQAATLRHAPALSEALAQNRIAADA